MKKKLLEFICRSLYNLFFLKVLNQRFIRNKKEKEIQNSIRLLLDTHTHVYLLEFFFYED